MKKFIWFAAVLLLFSCGEKGEGQTEDKFDQKTAIERIEKLEGELVSKENKALNAGAAQEVVKAYKEYANNLPLDAKAPEYLFKAADVEMGMRNYQNAIVLFQRVYDNYHTYEKRVMSLYLIAFTYDTHLDQKGKAKSVYEELIERHPEDKLAQDAIAALDLLTLSDEELIDFLKKKNQEQDSVQ